MKRDSLLLFQKAEQSIGAAERLLADEYPEFAVGRAYYAMFYAAEALLHEREFAFRKHGGVHAAFGEQFAKTGCLDPKFHRWMLDAFDKRIQSDYGVDAAIHGADAQVVIEQAREFLRACRDFLSNSSE
jgi:uncharacterized protein (UPF0332 family)